ncbi:GTPase Era [Ruminiclostridium cellulolyticum]|uniref:GTPase Era n=1 Tax=Ruminiclostridium cellulolyticum (strain ATCC 35319 / DSM 5812 / JCM 6584 / H10) TaxID=394503 RepID=ERA_RUMCH|nr:GTPase Era [Ruminiclostridium cellulolyticum]B8I736.1 RecName: Full=GTPase Era [Ruminiclostridium cellulolyticum H10]ACL74960.1 GTP-binding protein Era [Ruminiclostridium cellulolyticum H10]
MSYKSGFVSVIGRPNVGKSTLLNTITGQKIAIMSNKPQTTRNTIRGVITNKECQLILIDTPGIHKPKTKLGEYMVNVASETIKEVDLILFLVEANTQPGAQDVNIIQQLKQIKTPVFLILNKVDLISKDKLLAIIDSYSKLMDFKAIIPISALKNDGIDLILKEALDYIPEGPQFFSEDMLTDQPEKVIAAEMIREKVLLNLDDEVPHGVGVEVTSFKEREDGLINIQATIYCEKSSHKGIIIGKQGNMLKKIGSAARYEIERLLDTKIFLELWVKVKPDWRNSDNMLKTLGYKTNKN